MAADKSVAQLIADRLDRNTITERQAIAALFDECKRLYAGIPVPKVVPITDRQQEFDLIMDELYLKVLNRAKMITPNEASNAALAYLEFYKFRSGGGTN